jgi:hypothetical protein
MSNRRITLLTCALICSVVSAEASRAAPHAIADLTTGRLQIEGKWLNERFSNPCELMQRAVAPALRTERRRLPWRVRIEGEAQISLVDHAVYAKPDELICLALFGGPDTNRDGYPDDYAGVEPKKGHRLAAQGRFEIVWDADIDIDTTGQVSSAQFVQIGNTSRVGWRPEGNRLSNWVDVMVMSGRLTVRIRGDSDAGWPEGKIPAPESSAPHGSDTRYAVWSEEGVTRADYTRLTRFFFGNPRDVDDVGILHALDGWGIQNGSIYVSGFAVGLHAVGNYVGTTRGGRLESNLYNLVLGHPYRAGAEDAATPCRRGGKFCGSTTSDGGSHAFDSLLIEGARRSNLLVFGGRRWMFRNVWFESQRSGSGGHSVILGAGTSGKDRLPCGLDSDWGQPCRPPAGRRVLPQTIRFVGGILSGDEGHRKWEGLVLGPGFGKRSIAWLGSTLRESQVTKLGLPLAQSFEFHPDSTGKIDLRQVDTEGDDSIPSYPGVKR